MGLLKKFKNIFVEEYEEEEEEVVQMPSNFESRIPTRTEVKKVEPKIEQKQVVQENVPKVDSVQMPTTKQVVKESPVRVEEEKIKIEPVQPKKEEKFVFPVYFDDSDFAAINNKKEERPKPKVDAVKPNPKPESKEIKKESSYKEAYNNKRANLTEDKKVFKPTPIISPVYGILDKNYYKEDIVVTKSVTRTYSSVGNKPMSIDDVRNKAYGTLEDELTDSLITDEKVDTEETTPEASDDAIFSATDFVTAVEEDKKRDIVKDGLKSDIESLLNNEEFTSAINFRKTKISEPEEEVIPEKEEKIESVEEEESSSLVDDIMALAESGTDLDEEKEENEEIENNLEISGNDNEEEDDDISSNDEIELPESVTDNETLNAYDDVSDLNDSDLFDLIDSMYDKEDK